MMTEKLDACTSRDLLNEIVNVRKDLKEFIATSETRILSKLDTLQQKIREVEEENTSLKARIEKLERQSRRKNLIIFGLNKKPEDITLKTVCETLGPLLDEDISERDITDLYPLGRNQNCPVKLELRSTSEKRSLLTKDLERQENKILRKHLQIERAKSTSVRVYIGGSKLFVGGRTYTAEQLETRGENVSSINLIEEHREEHIDRKIVPVEGGMYYQTQQSKPNTRTLRKK
ncbi:hypothetical protein WA026_009026 [Henosepilachna vigintioctopunctata]|uniref:Endonuclease-reverse transcriptase n=1 Tax=Henosepilachna vigintioctopunctata TaxID=420089 RepID=A0AAW1UWE0_9CUCU